MEEVFIKRLNDVLGNSTICISHGLSHAVEVMNHAKRAIHFESNLKDFEKEAILIAVSEENLKK